LIGGADHDILYGGLGSDRFYFLSTSESGLLASTRDIIRDYVHGADKIDVSTIDATTAATGNQAFTFIGSSAFHHVAGQLHFVMQNPAGTTQDKTIVEGDVNGDGHADFQIELSGLKFLVASDFIL
jgi:serralysin